MIIDFPSLVSTLDKAPAWYLIVLSAFLVLWLLYRGLQVAILGLWRSIATVAFRHLVYPHLFPRLPYIGTSTRLGALVTILYIVTNTLLITIGAHTSSAISVRAATMSCINLVPLLCGPRLSLGAEFLGLPLRWSRRSHKWLGRTAIVEALVHTVIVLSHGYHSTNAYNTGLVAISAFGILGFVSLQFVTRIFYDFLLDLHLLFSGVAFIAGWRHVSKAPLARLAIQLAVTFWASISLLHWGYFVFRNVVVGRSFASVIATPVSDLTVVDGPRLDTTTVLQVDVAVPRPWSVRAGQHIFLSIPSLGILTGLRGHPFTIVSWHRGRQGLNISLLIEVRSGFTRALCQQAHKPLRAFIDGPFGGTHELGEFGTVIMVATGIGIAGHLMYLEKLVQGYRKLEVKTRRIVLIWQIQRESQQQWVKKWMDMVLKQDTDFILEASIYVDEYGKRNVQYGSHSKVKTIFGPLDIRSLLRKELENRNGALVVSICAVHSIADSARAELHPYLDSKVRLVELDFQPSRRARGSETDLDFRCKG